MLPYHGGTEELKVLLVAAVTTDLLIGNASEVPKAVGHLDL